MAITVVGSVGLDTVETPFGAVTDALGGATSYFALAASRYAPVNIVAVVGDDFPEEYRQQLSARRISLDGLQVEPGKTFRWGGRYGLDMNSRDTLFTDLGVFADFKPSVPASYAGADVVFLANIQPELQLGVLRQAGPGARLRALDTMNLWISIAKDALTEVMRQVDVVIIAEEEVRQYAEVPGLREGVRKILALGPERLVVKQGSYGALLFDRDGGFFAMPAYPLEEVRDPTGAGDSFAGGFLGYLAARLAAGATLRPSDYRRALAHGNIMGSYACEDFSVRRLLTLDAAAVDRRYDEFVSFTHFDGDWRENEAIGTVG
ncbi:MAG TPA: PfkB family carbohydrate kinase [Ktedonobacterales bacterium]